METNKEFRRYLTIKLKHVREMLKQTHGDPSLIVEKLTIEELLGLGVKKSANDLADEAIRHHQHDRWNVNKAKKQ